MTLELAAALLFVSLAVGLVAIEEYALERRRVYRSLRMMRNIEVAPTDLRGKELSHPAWSRLVAPLLRRVGRGIRRFAPSGVLDRLTQELVYAGSPVGWDAERVLATKLLLSVGLAIGSLLLGSAAGFPSMRLVAVAIVASVVGWYAPEWVLRSRSSQRQHEIQHALPDTLDMLSITVEAGLGFDAAVARVAKEVPGPLGEELNRMLQEMQLGKSRSDALRDLGERSTVSELRSFVLAMVQADIFGISIAKVLHTQARELRIKRRQRAEEQAHKIPLKILFPLLLNIFPALFIVLVGPAVLILIDVFSR